jgi:hypothetical protein
VLGLASFDVLAADDDALAAEEPAADFGLA